MPIRIQFNFARSFVRKLKFTLSHLHFNSQVASNPFRNWSHLAAAGGAKKIRPDFFSPSVLKSIKPGVSKSPVQQPDSSAATSAANRNRNVRNKRKEPC